MWKIRLEQDADSAEPKTSPAPVRIVLGEVGSTKDAVVKASVIQARWRRVPAEPAEVAGLKSFSEPAMGDVAGVHGRWSGAAVKENATLGI